MAERLSVTAVPDEPASDRDRICLVLAAVPAGRVTTYGELAALAGLPRRARLVGRILAELPATTRLPWHRVVRADGRIAQRGGGETEQARRLTVEGVLVRRGRIDLARHQWQP